MVLSLLKGENLLSRAALTPTRGIDRTIFEERDKIFSIWDFGGQQVYRKEYLERLEEYLEGTDQVIYLIDIQDESKYEHALDYLENIINVLNAEEYKTIDLSIYLHKFDPNLEVGTNRYDELLISIEKKLPKFSRSSIYKTSIVPIFRKVEEIAI